MNDSKNLEIIINDLESIKFLLCGVIREPIINKLEYSISDLAKLNENLKINKGV